MEATCKEDAFARYADQQEKKYSIACVVEVKSHPYKTDVDLELIAPDAHDVVNELLDRMRKDSKIYVLFCHKNGDDCITNKALVGKWELEVLHISEKNR